MIDRRERGRPWTDHDLDQDLLDLLPDNNLSLSRRAARFHPGRHMPHPRAYVHLDCHAIWFSEEFGLRPVPRSSCRSSGRGVREDVLTHNLELNMEIHESRQKLEQASVRLMRANADVSRLSRRKLEDARTIHELERKLATANLTMEASRARLHELRENAKILTATQDKLQLQLAQLRGESPMSFVALPISALEILEDQVEKTQRQLRHSLRLKHHTAMAQFRTNGSENDRSPLCIICAHDKVSVVLMPCHHQVLCAPCARKITTCPIDRKLITQWFEPFGLL